MSKEQLPITGIVEDFCHNSNDFFSLDRFREHVTPLNIVAKGNVLIVGPGELMEEVALIEPEVANGLVETITVIGARPVLKRRVKDAWQYAVPLEVTGTSWGQLFDSNPNLSYDTIIQVGTVSAHLADKLVEFASHLNPRGCLYLTLNGQPPIELTELKNCQMRIINPIPSNPNYDDVPNYFAVVVEKE